MQKTMCSCGKRIEGKGDRRCYACQEKGFRALQERVRLLVNDPKSVAARAENRRIIRARLSAERAS